MFACKRMRLRPGAHFGALAVLLTVSVQADPTSSPEAYLAWMQSSLDEVPAWNAWQERTGELPPDWAEMTRTSGLPDPLQFFDGTGVTGAEDWSARRSEILTAFQRWQWGSLPPKPTLGRIEEIDRTDADGYGTHTVRLHFGPEEQASLRVRVTLPAGKGPFPAVICTSLDGWSANLIPRGYAAVGFAGNDFMDDTAEIGALYPDYDFATLPRRAWAVQVVIDYLLQLPEIDPNKIALYGYSRDGKMATIAAAWDERIAAVIAGSTGVGGVLPWRLSGEAYMGESIASTTMMFPDWFHPRLRYFAGQEDRLPVDANLLVAAIAPRACLIQYGLNDEVSNGWANEQAYASALRAYTLLGAPERLGLLREPGFHGSIDPQRCLDWLDRQFGRVQTAPTWDNARMFRWGFEPWRERRARDFVAEAYPERVANSSLDRPIAEVRAAVRDLLGSPPPQPPTPVPWWRRGPPRPIPGPTHGQGAGPGQLAPDVPAWVIGRGIREFGWVDEDTATVDSRRIRFGHGLVGDLYWPRGVAADAKLPTVIWLHGFSYPLGYMWVYRRDLHPVLALAQAGYAVFAFDQSGFGSRQDETGPFYDRYPQWSRLGRMVNDVSAAVDALEQQERVDPARIQALGYSLGGLVALHAAALDERLQGVVSIGGMTPWRGQGASVLERFSHEHSLLPKLGCFVGAEDRVPYDMDELIAAIAPRPVLVVQPTMDRTADPAAVRAAVARARVRYEQHGASEALGLQEPVDILRFTEAMQQEAIEWMQAHSPQPRL